jgi:hypothetical protein
VLLAVAVRKPRCGLAKEQRCASDAGSGAGGRAEQARRGAAEEAARGCVGWGWCGGAGGGLVVSRVV